LEIEECVMQSGDMSKDNKRENETTYMEREMWLPEDSCKIGWLHLDTKLEA